MLHLCFYFKKKEIVMAQKKRQKLKENLLGYGFLSPALILLLIFLVIPVGMVIYYAFTDYYLLTPDERKFVGLANFVRLAKDPTFLKSVLNTAQFVVWIIPVQLGAALGMALIVNKKRKGNMFFKVAFFAPVVMSLVVISILWLYLLNPNNGLLNALLNKIGIASQPFLRSPKQAMYAIVFVSAWQGAGYQMLLFLGGMQNIPQDVYEAAELDGITKWQQFRYITMPLLKPTALFVLLTTLISAFKLIVQPMVMTQGGPMNSTITMNLSVIFHLKGINFTISGACASGSHAIGMAYMLIKSGLQDCILCGGAQEVNPYSVGSFDGLGAFSTREDEPEKASRPFDKGRDGLVPSGGGASLVLESYESAVRRGATILAEVIGYGFSSNGDHISVPNVDGPRRSLQMAINDAGIPLEEIQYINAHATSTPVGDLNEAKAIAEVFGSHHPYVTSTKSQTGHEMWMAGASEVIYSTLMMNNGFIAPNLNFEEPDEASALLNIPSRRVETEFDTFLSNSFGFGGTNSSLIIRKFKENN